jgi:hypothetical protein
MHDDEALWLADVSSAGVMAGPVVAQIRSCAPTRQNFRFGFSLGKTWEPEGRIAGLGWP